MPRVSCPALPDVSGVDLAYRPKSYFWPLPVATHLLARVKGAERKAALRHLIDTGRLREAPHFLAESTLADPERQAAGRIHPAFMGGEYLPDLMPDEVEIARITIASMTQDVTSVYARRGKQRIYYRVVDDYAGATLAGKCARTSRHPLTLGELETFFNGAWSIFDVLEMNFGDDGFDLDRMLSFVVGVESEFYPQFGDLYAKRVTAWATARRGELGMQ